jgi:hypothetical protein
MKFKDPASVVCPACGTVSKFSVKDLLARQALCPSCGRLQIETSERMLGALNHWADYVAAIVLTIELEEQYPGVRFDDAVLETIHCLRDLIVATGAVLNEIPEPEKEKSAAEAVKMVFSTAYPQVKYPPLDQRLSEVLRGVDILGWLLPKPLPRKQPR